MLDGLFSMSGTFENAQNKEPAYHFFKVAIQFKLTRQYSRADIIATVPAVRLNVSNIIVFHLIAAIFSTRPLVATQRRAVHSMKTFLVNNSSHLHSARMFKIFPKTIAGYSPSVLYYPYEGTNRSAPHDVSFFDAG